MTCGFEHPLEQGSPSNRKRPAGCCRQRQRLIVYRDRFQLPGVVVLVAAIATSGRRVEWWKRVAAIGSLVLEVENTGRRRFSIARTHTPFSRSNIPLNEKQSLRLDTSHTKPLATGTIFALKADRGSRMNRKSTASGG